MYSRFFSEAWDSIKFRKASSIVQTSRPLPVATMSVKAAIFSRVSSRLTDWSSSWARDWTRDSVALSFMICAYSRQFAAVGVIRISCTSRCSTSGPSLPRMVTGSTGLPSWSRARAAW